MSAETVRRWIGIALVVAAVLTMALVWGGLSLKDLATLFR
jgi:hypothetical protein